MPPPAPFLDASTECAICLEPMIEPDDDGDETTSAGQHKEVIVLSCGHKWHSECLREQLRTARPVPSRRLLFHGCRCGKCGAVCHHPSLEHFTRTTDSLRAEVDALVREQLAVDDPEILEKIATLESNHPPGNQLLLEAALDEARRKYAFYLCGHCRKPYFGGTVACADGLEEEPPDDNDTAGDRLCAACAPQPQSICEDPLEHRGHLVWKCRYCCRPATHVCYGNVHFCDRCHDRNDQRVRSGNRGTLAPIPCPGSSCPYPNPAGKDRHSNGPTPDCEQVYGCAVCTSHGEDRSRRRSRAEEEEANRQTTTPNLLANPCGERGLAGWRQLNQRSSWQVEPSDTPLRADTTTNFVSTFRLCAMEQTVDLAAAAGGLYHAAAGVKVEASARFLARTDCPSVFCLRMRLLDDQRRVLRETTSPVLDAPADFWDRVVLSEDLRAGDGTNPPRRCRYATVVVMGKDSRFWQGNYGSKVTDISLRLIGPPGMPGEREEEEQPQEEQPQGRQLQPQEQQQQQQDRQLLLLREGLLPIILCFILAWWIQNASP